MNWSKRKEQQGKYIWNLLQLPNHLKTPFNACKNTYSIYSKTKAQAQAQAQTYLHILSRR